MPHDGLSEPLQLKAPEAAGLVLCGSIKRQLTKSWGTGLFATDNIKSGAIVLKERPLMLPGKVESTIDTMFKLIKLVLDRSGERFIQSVPHKLEKEWQYSPLESAHKAFCPELSREEAILYAYKFMRNAFTTENGPALLLTGQLFNHSCKPNLLFTYENGLMVFRTCYLFG